MTDNSASRNASSACGEAGKFAAQVEGKGERECDAVDGGDESHLDTVDQRGDGTGHLFITRRIELTQSHDKADKVSENTETRQDVGDIFQDAAVYIRLDRILIDKKLLDVAGAGRVLSGAWCGTADSSRQETHSQKVAWFLKRPVGHGSLRSPALRSG